MPNAVTPVEANNICHSREGGNPVFLDVKGCTRTLDSRLRGNDGEGGLNGYDILMISDGDCCLSPEFNHTVKIQKEILNCMIYSVLCAGTRIEDTFSDEVVVL